MYDKELVRWKTHHFARLGDNSYNYSDEFLSAFKNSEYKDEIIEAVTRYGDNAIELVTRYGDNAAEVISKAMNLVSIHNGCQVDIPVVEY